MIEKKVLSLGERPPSNTNAEGFKPAYDDAGRLDIKSLNETEVVDFIISMGQAGFRGKQVYGWLNKGTEKFEDMRNIPRILMDELNKKCYISVADIEKKQVSVYDGTVKYLFRLNDGEYVESVLMKYHHGYTLCISTQVGCKMGCSFCATGKGGFTRNLTPSEMLCQIEKAERDNQIRISNIVLMGMGEPLDNFYNVVRFIQLVTSQEGLNIGGRHISLSTCGIVPRIYQLAEYGFGLTLSVSLHAPNNELRSKTMPVNHKYPIEELLKACRYYAEKTKRRISFEYAMISNVNDMDQCAHELGKKLKGMLCHVNLIPVNNVVETDYRKSSRDRLEAFVKILEKYSVTATIRRTLGSDIDASCGQLRGKHMSKGGV